METTLSAFKVRKRENHLQHLYGAIICDQRTFGTNCFQHGYTALFFLTTQQQWFDWLELAGSVGEELGL